MNKSDNAIINYHIELENLLVEADEKVRTMTNRLNTLEKVVDAKWVKNKISKETYGGVLEDLKDDNLNLSRSLRLKEKVIDRLKKKTLSLEEELLEAKLDRGDVLKSADYVYGLK